MFCAWLDDYVQFIYYIFINPMNAKEPPLTPPWTVTSYPNRSIIEIVYINWKTPILILKFILKYFIYIQAEMASIRPMFDHNLTSKVWCNFTTLFALSQPVSFAFEVASTWLTILS